MFKATKKKDRKFKKYKDASDHIKVSNYMHLQTNYKTAYTTVIVNIFPFLTVEALRDKWFNYLNPEKSEWLNDLIYSQWATCLMFVHMLST